MVREGRFRKQWTYFSYSYICHTLNFFFMVVHSPTLSLLFRLLSSICPNLTFYCQYTYYKNVCSIHFGAEIKSQNSEIVEVHFSIYMYVNIHIQVGKRFKFDQFMHMTIEQYTILTPYIKSYVFVLYTSLFYGYVYLK